MGKKNYPAHSSERVFQARYTDKKGRLVKQTRACSIAPAAKRIAPNFLRYSMAVEVEIIHIHDRVRHSEVLATITRGRYFDIETRIIRPHLPG